MDLTQLIAILFVVFLILYLFVKQDLSLIGFVRQDLSFSTVFYIIILSLWQFGYYC